MRSKHAPNSEDFLVHLATGDKMVINPSDYVGFRIYMCGYYEPETVAAVQAKLKPGMTFFDIGAHFGQYTLVGASAVGPQGKVFAFEPGPVQQSYLKRNVELNGHKHVTLNQIALGDHEGVVGFVIDNEGNLGGSHLSTSNEKSTIEVELTTLDSYCAKHGISHIDVMKVDVEGAELMMFKGASNVLDTVPPTCIFYECIDSLSRKFGCEAKEVHELLVSKGYKICVTENGQIVEAGSEKWPLHSDFIAVR